MQYYSNYITKEEEEYLLKIIDSNPWCKDIRRRQQHIGYKYYHTRHNLPFSQPLEQPKDILPLKPFEFLITRLEQDGIFPIDNHLPTQILVNEYIEDQRIASHKDNEEAFGKDVISLSLLDPVYMTMKKCEDINIETKVLMERRSILVLKGDARFKWKHGITKMKHYPNPVTGETIHKGKNFRRVSLTIRKILINGTKKTFEGDPNDDTCTW